VVFGEWLNKKTHRHLSAMGCSNCLLSQLPDERSTANDTFANGVTAAQAALAPGRAPRQSNQIGDRSVHRHKKPDGS